jgi:ATP-dependent Lhr-like helicase
MGLGLVTNDRLDPLREGSDVVALALAAASQRDAWGRRRGPSGRRASMKPEGRWSLVGSDSPEDQIARWSEVLLDRYGVLTRETVALESWSPSWRDLSPHLARLELRGEMRRGYFVEGLSGVQYARAETAEALSSQASHQGGRNPLVLMSSLDPANLYGSGAPLDIDLLEGGTARLSRSKANHLVVCGGRPILIIEANGSRLTGLASSSEEELIAAVARLPALTGPSRRVLKVETYNGAPSLASPAAPWLAAAGFVRDYPGMAYYAAC